MDENTMSQEDILQEYRGLIGWCVNRYKHNVKKYNWLDVEDLEQAAAIGILKAQEKYDPDKGKFSTVAMPYMQREIYDALRIQWRPDGYKTEPETLSLDAPVAGADDEDLTLGGTIASDDLSPDDRAELDEMITRVRDAVGQLPDRERDVIERLYLAEVPCQHNQIPGCTLDQVHRYEKYAFKKLREMLGEYYCSLRKNIHVSVSAFNGRRWSSEVEIMVLDRIERQNELKKKYAMLMAEVQALG